ncbi:hypothetical protein GEMRC1_007628 [Eukaryota sp. GEM-RC1]
MDQLASHGGIKTVVVGEMSVGKTSFISSLSKGSSRKYNSGFHRTTVNLSEFVLDVWDADSDLLEGGPSATTFFNNITVAIVLYDSTDTFTLNQAASKWIPKVRRAAAGIIILVGTKSDLLSVERREEISSKAEEISSSLGVFQLLVSLTSHDTSPLSVFLRVLSLRLRCFVRAASDLLPARPPANPPASPPTIPQLPSPTNSPPTLPSSSSSSISPLSVVDEPLHSLSHSSVAYEDPPQLSPSQPQPQSHSSPTSSIPSKRSHYIPTSTPISPAFTSPNYLLTKLLEPAKRSVLLNIKLSDGRIGQIEAHDGDSAHHLAQLFVKAFRLSSNHVPKIARTISRKLFSLSRKSNEINYDSDCMSSTDRPATTAVRPFKFATEKLAKSRRERSHLPGVTLKILIDKAKVVNLTVKAGDDPDLLSQSFAKTFNLGIEQRLAVRNAIREALYW